MAVRLLAVSKQMLQARCAESLTLAVSAAVLALRIRFSLPLPACSGMGGEEVGRVS